MTNTQRYPKPTEPEKEFLYDLAWDLRDTHRGAVPLGQDIEKYLYWLHRYEGFTEWELEVKPPLETTQVIGYRD
jgi:hypothetical protein